MLPSWFDDLPWGLLLEGDATGTPYSYFVKFKRLEDGYEFYITDLCTIWREECKEEAIKTKLKPFENFLELSTPDLLEILLDMFTKDDKIKVSLQPGPEEDLRVEAGTQIGFVKFSWPFDCTAIDYKTSSQHFRSKLIIPALKNVSGLDKKAISKDEWKAFTSKCIKAASSPLPPVSIALSSQSTQPTQSPEVPLAVSSQPPVDIVSTQTQSTQTTTQRGNPEAEMERRRQLEELMKQKQAAADEKKKKRKLI